MSQTINPVSPPQQAAVLPPLNNLPRANLDKILKRAKRRPWGRVVWILFGLVLLSGLAWGVKWWFFSDSGGDKEITFTVKRANLPITVTERGELESSVTQEVRCEMEGRQNKIVSIVPEGKRVKKGEVVLVFDADELTKLHGEQKIKWEQANGKAEQAKEEMDININKADEEVDKATRALQLAKLDLLKYIHPEGEYTADLAEKQGALELAKKELKEAEEKLVQFRKSVKKGLFPAEQLRLKEAEFEQKQYAVKRDDAKLTVVIKFTKERQITELKGKVDDAKRALERAESSKKATVRKGKSDVKAAENTAALEKSTLDRLQKQLDRCQVRSPEEGIVVYSRDRWWDDSARIQAGATVFQHQGLFSLPDLEHMQTKVKIHEAMVKKVKPGMKAEVRIDAYQGKVLHGTVKSVATMASQEGWFDRFTKEYQTIVVVDDLPLDAGLKPGFTGETKIFVNEIPNVLVVPVQAVGQKEGEHFCYVVGPNGIEARSVTIGENNDKFVQIKEGLEEGEKVVLDARARIAEEMKGGDSKPGEPAKPASSDPQVTAAPKE